MQQLGLFICSLMLICAGLAAEEKETPPETGVLVVTYNTGRNAERLDRIRFRITNDQKEQRMLPHAGEFMDSPASQSRRVIVRNLPVGKYTLEFIIPNFDGLFGEIPQREVVITSGEMIKVDQAIKPRYARVKVTSVMPDGSSTPRILLCNKQGIQIARGSQGELLSSNLIPGEYVIMFERKTGYREPEPIRISVAAGAILGPFERHYVPTTEAATEPPIRPTPRQLSKENQRRYRGQISPHVAAGSANTLPIEAASREFTSIKQTADIAVELQPTPMTRPLRQFTPGVTESQLTSPECQRCPDHCKNRFWTNFDAETCGLLPCCVDLHELYGDESFRDEESDIAWEDPT